MRTTSTSKHPPRPKPYSLAKKYGHISYAGKLCEAHPEAKGRRYTVNHLCVPCGKAKSSARYAQTKSKRELEKERKARNQKQREHYAKNKDRVREYYRSRLPEYLLRGAQFRAKKKGMECTLTLDDIVIPEICPVFGIPMDSPSLDRVNNEKGYTPENVKVISKQANLLKRDGNIEQFRQILAYMENNT